MSSTQFEPGVTQKTGLANGYQCLNRKDVSENALRSSVIYENFVSTRKNLFQYFKANDTMNYVAETQIICDYQRIDINCTDYTAEPQMIECKKEKRDNGGIALNQFEFCDALDFLEDKGLPAPPVQYTRHIYASPQKLGM